MSAQTRNACLGMISKNWESRHTPEGYARIKIALAQLGRAAKRK